MRRQGRIAGAWGQHVPGLLEARAEGCRPWQLTLLSNDTRQYGLEPGAALAGAPQEVVLACCTANAARWAAATESGHLYILSTEGGALASSSRLASGAIDMKWSRDGAVLAVLSANGSVQLYDTALSPLTPLKSELLGTSMELRGSVGGLSAVPGDLSCTIRRDVCS